jgi:mRNA interferase MazF
MINISPRQYEIWIANLDLSAGSEPGKTRPVVILQSDVLNIAGHTSSIVCAISSQPRQVATSVLRLPVSPSSKNGLQKQSYILCDQIRAIDLSRISMRVGVLDTDVVMKLKQSITAILDI